MITSRLTIIGDIGGVSFSSTVVINASGKIGHELTANAAKAGTLSVRTSASVGTLTLSAGHGIQTGDKVDLYWDGGRRYNVTVGTVVTTSVPISAGAGDDLPSVDTAVTVAKHQELDTDFEGNLLVAIGSQCGARGHLCFFDSSTLELAVDLTAKALWYWQEDGTATNPLASKSITHVTFTQAGIADDTFKLGLLYDSAS